MYLSQRGITFIERDIMADPSAVQELEKLGFLTTPVIVVGDEVVVGFNRERLEQLLE